MTLPKTEFTTILLTVDAQIATITLNRPSARNAIDNQMRQEFRQAVEFVAADPDVRVVILTGAGSAFCSGGDIKGMAERLALGSRVAEVGWRRQRELHEILNKWHFLDKPTIAAVNGAAFGLGLDVALSCDFVFAAHSATLSASFILRGLVPDGGGLFYLPRRVGLSTAKDLIFTGRTLSAQEAVEIGLVDRVFSPESLISEASAYAATLAAQPATAQALAKNILNRSFEMTLEQANAAGAQAQAICYGSSDHQERVRAFLDRPKR